MVKNINEATRDSKITFKGLADRIANSPFGRLSIKVGNFIAHPTISNILMLSLSVVCLAFSAVVTGGIIFPAIGLGLITAHLVYSTVLDIKDQGKKNKIIADKKYCEDYIHVSAQIENILKQNKNLPKILGIEEISNDTGQQTISKLQTHKDYKATISKSATKQIFKNFFQGVAPVIVSIFTGNIFLVGGKVLGAIISNALGINSQYQEDKFKAYLKNYNKSLKSIVPGYNQTYELANMAFIKKVEVIALTNLVNDERYKELNPATKTYAEEVRKLYNDHKNQAKADIAKSDSFYKADRLQKPTFWTRTKQVARQAETVINPLSTTNYSYEKILFSDFDNNKLVAQTALRKLEVKRQFTQQKDIKSKESQTSSLDGKHAAKIGIHRNTPISR